MKRLVTKVHFQIREKMHQPGCQIVNLLFHVFGAMFCIM